jgi:hypothetical protein
MASKSLLGTIGSDIKGVFKWLASPTGQRVIAVGEIGLEVAVPGLTGIINIANKWMSEIFKTEALAAGALQQAGSGVDKAAITITALTPEILAFAKQNGFAASRRIPSIRDGGSSARGAESTRASAHWMEMAGSCIWMPISGFPR